MLCALSLLPVAGYFGMAFFTGWIGVLIGLTFQIGRGITQVILRDALNWRIPNEFRATANSLSSLFFRLGFCLIGPLVGYLIDKFGISWTVQALGVSFFLFFFLFMLPLMKEVKELRLNEIPS